MDISRREDEGEERVWRKAGVGGQGEGRHAALTEVLIPQQTYTEIKKSSLMVNRRSLRWMKRSLTVLSGTQQLKVFICKMKM